MLTKTCTKCHVEYPATAEFFPPSKQNRDGFCSWCRVCFRASVARWQAAHPEVQRATKARYRAAHQEAIRAYAARYRAAHPKIVAAANARYRATHSETVRAANARWRAAHPELVHAYNVRWREMHPEASRAATVRYRAAHPETVRAGTARWDAAHPEAAKARRVAKRAIQDGRLIYPDFCERCGQPSKKLVKHHEDYARPLDVLFVCRRCHKKIHAIKQGTA